MKNKRKYSTKDFKKIQPNKIEVIKSKAGGWKKSSNSKSWFRPLYEHFISCERLTMCAYIEKRNEFYVGTCVGLDEAVKSPDLNALMCTLDIILLNNNIEIKNSFGKEDL